uniref:Zinc finger protein 609 n=1 Tax=Sus scrofa TaxID=9823 RepID=A0A8D0TES6_PIG
KNMRFIVVLNTKPELACVKNMPEFPLWLSNAPHPESLIPGLRGFARAPSLTDLVKKEERSRSKDSVPKEDGKPHLLHVQHPRTQWDIRSWRADLSSRSLYVEIPGGVLGKNGSKRGWLKKLSLEAEKIRLNYNFICWRGSRKERGPAMKTLSSLGFPIIEEGHPRVPGQPDTAFLTALLDKNLSRKD